MEDSVLLSMQVVFVVIRVPKKDSSCHSATVSQSVSVRGEPRGDPPQDGIDLVRARSLRVRRRRLLRGLVRELPVRDGLLSGGRLTPRAIWSAARFCSAAIAASVAASVAAWAATSACWSESLKGPSAVQDGDGAAVAGDACGGSDTACCHSRPSRAIWPSARFQSGTYLSKKCAGKAPISYTPPSKKRSASAERTADPERTADTERRSLI
jgi:hypothetical protein